MRRRWKVRVGEENYGRVAVVYLTKQWFPLSHQSGVRVATIDLARDDAEERIAEARARAQSYASSLTRLEAVKV